MPWHVASARHAATGLESATARLVPANACRSIARSEGQLYSEVTHWSRTALKNGVPPGSQERWLALDLGADTGVSKGCSRGSSKSTANTAPGQQFHSGARPALAAAGLGLDERALPSAAAEI